MAGSSSTAPQEIAATTVNHVGRGKAYPYYQFFDGGVMREKKYLKPHIKT